jgi:hypothetical protein
MRDSYGLTLIGVPSLDLQTTSDLLAKRKAA